MKQKIDFKIAQEAKNKTDQYLLSLMNIYHK